MAINPPGPIDPAAPTPAWAQTVISAHTAVTTAVSHGKRIRSDRYFCWQEDDDNDLLADNGHEEIGMTGYTDLFTKKEFDPWGRQLEAAFDAAGISWERTGISYEQDTGFFHWSWDWEVFG